MAFNRAKFNHVPFNVQSDMIKYIIVSGLEEVDATIGSALNFYPLAIANERVAAEPQGMKGRFIEAVGEETISENVVEAQMTVIIFPHFEENVAEETELRAVITPKPSFMELLSGEWHKGANIYPDAEANEKVTINRRHLSAKIYPHIEGYELVSNSASLENVEIKTCVLTLTLKPGQTLIVDAINYNILLDNENAIEIQSGDWIDELNRNTTDITISAAAGASNLSASILYTERYL